MAVGIGKNLSRARLLLAQRAGYLPPGFRINPRNAPAQWRAASRNLTRDARRQGYGNPLQMLRELAVGAGPNAAAPEGLAYVNSRLAATAPMTPDPMVLGMRNSFRTGPPIAPELGEETQPLFRPDPISPFEDVAPLPRPIIGGPDYRGAARRFAAARRRPIRRPISGAEY